MVTPNEVLRLAERLATEASEVAQRAAVSRAYYAAFLHLRKRLEEDGRYLHRRSGAEHGAVERAAAAYGEPARLTLWVLRRRRNQADYEIDDAFTRARCEFALLCAQRLLRA